MRAMRSMRSLAHMKSWANMGSANSDKEGNNITTHNTNAHTTVTTGTTKENSERKKEKKNREKKQSKKTKEEMKTVRMSSSSFEIGGPSPQGTLSQPVQIEQTMKKKQSIIGLGIPGSVRLRPNGHRLSNASSTRSISGPHPPVSMVRTRFSSESAHLVLGADGRPASTVSSGSSLRPPSSSSCVSAFSMRSPRSSSGSTTSVRWDEEGLQHVKEMQRRERKIRRDSVEAKPRTSQDSRRGSEGRRRVAITDVFPEFKSTTGSPTTNEPPIVTVQEATVDDEDLERLTDVTPVKKVRPRPVSDQMAGRARPKPMTDDCDGESLTDSVGPFDDPR